ncbi:hypothetical protein [uncultured Marinobacter sp.]|uniref:hypothetical protein n=1 Tax=uncultured Marinobacter sp. TaxID=187379 RepID=UPI0025930CF2|nr:hypothetical protein [uncultured Marinobacter sp.]|tara:strand:+ start:165 stop:356 length:192 start_codon:yes stop_codon:yes gene_type:complete
MTIKERSLKPSKHTLAVALAGTLFAGAAQAQLAGHNVILVHGFMMDDLSNPPASFSDVQQAVH